ncbi:reverse transcriptase domain-containing protein [Tanacetum coccineum]
MQSLSGKLAALNHFLSRSAERAMPFFDTLKNITKENKDDFRWTKAAEQAFQELKTVIMELPMLTTPNLKETLYVYLAASGEAVSGVLMADRRGKQTPVRYVSRTLHEAEKNYTPLEKLALCLLHLSRRLRRYFEAHPIKVITDQPIKQILNKPEASGKLAKYAVELGAYNIAYMPRNAVKGQVLADFLNEVPVGTGNVEICSLSNNTKVEEWTLFTDGASSLKGAGAGLVLVDPTGTEYTYAIRLNFASTNNEAEYESLLAGLRIAGKMKIPALKVKVDSKLVACQMNGEFVANNDGMAKYLMKAKELSAGFEEFSIENIPRNQNLKANVLSKLASVAFNHLTKEILVEVLNDKSIEAQEVNAIVEEEEDNWMTPIIKCIEEGIWLEDENEARTLRIKIGQYVMEEGILFKKSYLSPMLRCVGPLQANYIIREVHEGACGMHAGARSVVAKIIRQ